MARLRCALVLLLLLLQTGAFGKVCPEGTFRPGEGKACQQCRVCDRTLKEKHKCTATTDAICECADGFNCTGTVCVPCECGLGQQRTFTGCENCPEKTFNDRRTGNCRPWRTCPDDKIREPGTRERDVVCWTGSDIPTTQPSTSLSAIPTKVAEGGNQLVLISSAFAVTILLFATCMVLAYLLLRSWFRRKFWKPFPGQLAQEVDDCTYRYPQEEEGGSCEAPSVLKGGLLEEYYPQEV